jgi:hypothetical protein
MGVAELLTQYIDPHSNEVHYRAVTSEATCIALEREANSAFDCWRKRPRARSTISGK